MISKMWAASEAQCILEARTAIFTLKRLCRCIGNFSQHHLILGDAMAVVLALTKGRSSSPVLLSICRQWCAYSLAADIYGHLRWVPSQENAADDPSRNRSRHLPDADVAEAQVTAWSRSKGEYDDNAQLLADADDAHGPVLGPSRSKDEGSAAAHDEQLRRNAKRAHPAFDSARCNTKAAVGGNPHHAITKAPRSNDIAGRTSALPLLKGKRIPAAALYSRERKKAQRGSMPHPTSFTVSPPGQQQQPRQPPHCKWT